MASKTKFATPLLAGRHTDDCEGGWLQIHLDLLRRSACRRTAPALLAFGSREVRRPAGLAMAGYIGAPEMYEVRQCRLGRSPTPLRRGHQLPSGGEWMILTRESLIRLGMIASSLPFNRFENHEDSTDQTERVFDAS